MPSADDILKLLDQISAKIQGPAEQVFNLYLWRIIVEAAVTGILSLIGIIVSVWLLTKTRTIFIAVKTMNKSHYDDGTFEAVLSTGGYLFATIALLGISVANLAQSVIKLLTPQYEALSRIITQITGH